jgi:hypothetical protein
LPVSLFTNPLWLKLFTDASGPSPPLHERQKYLRNCKLSEGRSFHEDFDLICYDCLESTELATEFVVERSFVITHKIVLKLL